MASDCKQFDEQMMRRAIRVAMDGRGIVEPNPMVGCVIVKDGRVIGEGHTQKFGGAHAEPTALASCSESPAGATAYVTLEPCCHTNKKTPPCTPRLIEAKIAHVVVGCLDPNPEVNGKGLQQLREAGIEVVWPVLENSAKQLIAPFLLWFNPKRPYVTLKWAQTSDGKVAGAGGARRQITGERAHRTVHQLRSRCDAIMVGVNTVLIDDPMLTARVDIPAMPRHLHRFVIDSNLRIPLESKLVQSSNYQTVDVFCSQEAYAREDEKVRALRRHEVHLHTFKADPNTHYLPLRRVVGACDCAVHLLVEPGPNLAAAFFRAEIADRLWLFQSPIVIDDASAPAAARVPPHWVKTGEIELDEDRLIEYLNPKSPVYFRAESSADFVLAAQT